LEAATTSPLTESSDRARTRTATALLWVGLLIVLLLPNRWTGNGSIHPWSQDVVSYERIAAAAPDLPSGTIGSAYSERFVPHYLVGLVNEVTGASLHASYRILALLCIAAILFVAHRVFAELRPPWWIYAFGVSLFVLAPYSLRAVILEPGSYQDLVFVLGAGLTLFGLLRVSVPLVLVGAAVALCGRQTALLFGLAAAFWILVAPEWRRLENRPRIGTAVATVGLLAVGYLTIKAIVHPFTAHFAPDSLHDTIVFGAPGLGATASHFARCLEPIVVPGTALATVVAILAAAGARLRELPTTLWLALLLALAIAIQPAVINPDFPGFSSNEQRLTGIALLPLCVALAIALLEADRRRLLLPSPALVYAGLAVIAVTSLHHIFTVVGPSGKAQSEVLQVLGALALAAGLLYARWDTARRTS
jgi:hypothetical protein